MDIWLLLPFPAIPLYLHSEEVAAELGSDSQGGTRACEFLTLLEITSTSNQILKCMGKPVATFKPFSWPKATTATVYAPPQGTMSGVTLTQP